MQRSLVAAFFLFIWGLADALPAQTRKVLVLNGAPDQVTDFQSVSPKVRIVSATQQNVTAEIADAEGFIGVITPAMFSAAKNLKWVGVMSAGVENVLWVPGAEAFRGSGVILTNNKVVQGPEIADHAFALLLYNTRRLNEYGQNKDKEDWARTPFKGIELRGKTALIIGVGGIGTQIAIRAWAFGMKVIGVDPEDKPFVPYIERIVKPDQLDEVVPEADVVFISTPDTNKSHKMFGGREFELMKQNSYFIAVSRGGIYDMNGLVKALDSRKLAGAGVDVVDPEPLPKGHALWKFDNVMITPHIAGRSDRDNARMLGTIKDNIRRFADGMPMVNVVDKQKGY
jgi:phosphoglycerate dehydrogenase-like enzyme